MIHQVVEFNRTILGIEQRELGIPQYNEVHHLIKCLNEETVEFLRAYKMGDFIGMIDALIDNLYFGLGGLYKLGLTPEAVIEIFGAVHDANMTKKAGIVQHRATEGCVDAVKPESWVPPEERISQILDRYTKQA
jgi:predicted HAD superfamily Cof-like phosphohydrolase